MTILYVKSSEVVADQISRKKNFCGSTTDQFLCHIFEGKLPTNRNGGYSLTELQVTFLAASYLLSLSNIFRYPSLTTF